MKVHFLGIGGSGTSAAAALAQTQGFEVTGCDLDIDNEFTKVFKKDQLFKRHNPDHLQNTDLLVVTPAIFSLDPNNPELKTAKKVITWQQFLGEYLTKDKFVIAVCGTHGKSTTTAMIAKMLEDANLDPTVELGAIVPSWKTNFRVGKGRYFVIEADEFNDNFLHFKPDITVVTNIEMDHPEYFKDFEAVKKSFAKFKSQSKKVFDKPNPRLIKFKLQIPGDFNVANASLAFQVGLALDLNPGSLRKSLANYQGIGRRFEYVGDYNPSASLRGREPSGRIGSGQEGAKVYSDFGHHPTEIKVTMEAARQKFSDKRILLIYQPHMFSRTKVLFDDFVKVFKNLPIDKIFIMDIYPSREVNTGLVSTKQLTGAISKDNVVYIGSTAEVLKKLKPEIKSGDIIFFMSAGDTDKLAKELVSGAFSRPVSKHQYKSNSQ